MLYVVEALTIKLNPVLIGCAPVEHPTLLPHLQAQPLQPKHLECQCPCPDCLCPISSRYVENNEMAINNKQS